MAAFFGAREFAVEFSMSRFHSKDTTEIISLVSKRTFVGLIDTGKFFVCRLKFLFHEIVYWSPKPINKVLGHYENISPEKLNTVIKLKKHSCAAFLFKSRTIKCNYI